MLSSSKHPIITDRDEAPTPQQAVVGGANHAAADRGAAHHRTGPESPRLYAHAGAQDALSSPLTSDPRDVFPVGYGVVRDRAARRPRLTPGTTPEDTSSASSTRSLYGAASTEQTTAPSRKRARDEDEEDTTPSRPPRPAAAAAGYSFIPPQLPPSDVDFRAELMRLGAERLPDIRAQLQAQQCGREQGMMPTPEATETEGSESEYMPDSNDSESEDSTESAAADSEDLTLLSPPRPARRVRGMLAQYSDQQHACGKWLDELESEQGTTPATGSEEPESQDATPSPPPGPAPAPAAQQPPSAAEFFRTGAEFAAAAVADVVKANRAIAKLSRPPQ